MKKLTPKDIIKRNFNNSKYLTILYRKFNRKFFNNELPKDVILMYSNLPEKVAGCCVSYDVSTKDGFKFRIRGIEMSKKTFHKKVDLRYLWMVFIHEMNHLYTGSSGHGEKFQKGMIRLANKGAFKGIW